MGVRVRRWVLSALIERSVNDLGLIDLHIHTTASDGLLSPEDVVTVAVSRGLRVIAITDHDTVDGVHGALNAVTNNSKLEVIPGIEISTDISAGEIHILGYFIDYRNVELLSVLHRLKESRETRAFRMIAKLADMGILVSLERVKELSAGGSIGRPHIAQVMLENKQITSFREAFDKYIGHEGPAYVEREKITPVEAVQLLVRSGALPVLAHPANLVDLDVTLSQLQHVGLIGLETYYACYAGETIEYLAGIAKKHGLIPTGGSDYHGINAGDIGGEIGSVDVPMSSFEQLAALSRNRTTNK